MLIQSCNIEEWSCADETQYISKNYLCDGETDCYDGSDEHCDLPSCESLPTVFPCTNGTICVSVWNICDGHRDCADGSDEARKQCELYATQLGSWLCESGDQNIDVEFICNDEYDCDDRSDEAESQCKNCAKYGRWPCKDGKRCVEQYDLCDGEPHCNDGSDENCDLPSCESFPTVFPCKNGTTCVGAFSVCNGFRDCDDGSDEDPSECHKCTLHPDRWLCKSGDQCIGYEDLCDERSDCDDGSDEICENCELWPCKDGKGCVESYYICNGENDCEDGSDETECKNCTLHGGWLCKDDKQCIQQIHVCDGKSHCADGSDEFASVCDNCTSKQGLWPCKNGLQCVKESHICDGKPDCKDESDEDEMECKNCTQSGRHRCITNGVRKCISKDQVCDGTHIDCDDYSDENLDTCKNCSQAKLEACKDGSYCVDKQNFCNGQLDCPDGSDESESECENCAKDDYLPCPGNPNHCIPRKKFRDGERDCPDWSDESLDAHVGNFSGGCYEPQGLLCPALCDGHSTAFVCPDRSFCISVYDLLDGKRDCKDGSDEHSKYFKTGWWFDSIRLANLFPCVGFKNDSDYENAFDELSLDLRSHNLWHQKFDFWSSGSNPEIIQNSRRCSQLSEDSHLCPIVPKNTGIGADMDPKYCKDKCYIVFPNVLDPLRRPCKDGSKCLSVSRWCDGTEHCRDGSDEIGCTFVETIETSPIS